jgi:hypothetical protein
MGFVAAENRGFSSRSTNERFFGRRSEGARMAALRKNRNTKYLLPKKIPKDMPSNPK